MEKSRYQEDSSGRSLLLFLPLGQAEQHCTHEHTVSGLYSTVQLPGASLASVTVTLFG